MNSTRGQGATRMSYHWDEGEEPHLHDESCGHLESQLQKWCGSEINAQATTEVCTLEWRPVLSFKETYQCGQDGSQSWQQTRLRMSGPGPLDENFHFPFLLPFPVARRD